MTSTSTGFTDIRPPGRPTSAMREAGAVGHALDAAVATAPRGAGDPPGDAFVPTDPVGLGATELLATLRSTDAMPRWTRVIGIEPRDISLGLATWQSEGGKGG